MKIIASVQAKRGSSRGLVHYIAHSKLDVDREQETGRELFNAFADHLSVESANNSLKVGIGHARPSNDELHHLVLSFRPGDYRSLGRDEKARRHAVKEMTRAAMMRLKKALTADRLYWAAAVHLNTENPHVHIALHKQYFTKDIEREVLSKIPREALPHYEKRDGEKVLVSGCLIEGATERMEYLAAREKEYAKDRNEHAPRARSTTESAIEIQQDRHQDRSADQENESEVLRRGILAEYELHRIESKTNQLIDHGDKMRFLFADPLSGRKVRLSLRDIEARRSRFHSEVEGAPERQIRTILLKMIAKEESTADRFRKETADAVREAKRVRAKYRENDRKLPPPSLTKEELDNLQEYCLDASEIRRFSYLESVRAELERTAHIEPRSKKNLGRMAAEKAVSNLRAKAYERGYLALSERRYYRFVEIGDKRVSLAQLDREESDARNPLRSFVEKLRDAASRLSGRTPASNAGTENDRLRNDIVIKLEEQLTGIERERKTERSKTKLLEKISSVQIVGEPNFSPEHLAEVHALASRLKLSHEYEKNWEAQRTLIAAAAEGCPAYLKMRKADPTADFAEHQASVIAGRALAMEILAEVELEKAKDDLKLFTESKKFQKFPIEDKGTGAIEFVSLRDVDLPQSGSLLDRAVVELFESREHRRLRRTIVSIVKDKERRLNDDLVAAKEIVESASRYASEFKQQVSALGLTNQSSPPPIFTSSEVTAIEARIAGTQNPREATRLRTNLESVDKPLHSLAKMLRNFENPETILPRDRDIAIVAQGRSRANRDAGTNGLDPKTPRSPEHTFPGRLR